jgi:hypothetical protein
LPHRLDTVHTILQPQFAPEMTPPASINLPEVFFWAPQVRVPKFVAPFRTPGHQAAPTQARTLDAPPKLQAPTLEPPDISTQAPLNSLSTLSARFPSTLPIRTSDDATKWSGATADPIPGDPTTLLSLSLDPSRVPEFLSVPPGNQLGRMPEAGASGAISASAPGTGTGGHGAGKPSGPAGSDHPGAGPGGDHPASGDPDSTKTAAVPGAPGSAGKPAQPGGAVPAATASAENNVVLSLAGLRAAAIAAAAPTRIAHAVGGVFDVVVQSTGAEGFPESAGALSGKPIYNAYVRTGASKDWLLQYCIPGAQGHKVEVSGSVARIGTDSPLSAPYPLVTFRPPVRSRPGHYVMVHGLITTMGRFQDLSILGSTEVSDTAMVLGVLEQWEFRPATQDGRAVSVEILLAIPAE